MNDSSKTDGFVDDVHGIVRMCSTNQAQGLRDGRAVLIANPDDSSDVRMFRGPSHAQHSPDLTTVTAAPRASSWYEPKVDGRTGYLQMHVMTCSSSDLPSGKRHEDHPTWRFSDAVLYATGAIRTRQCWDKQRALGSLNEASVQARELLDAPPCPSTCCTDGSDGFNKWNGTPACSKTAREREVRMKRYAAAQKQLTDDFERKEMARDLAVANAANDHAAATMGPAIASGIASAMKLVMAELAESKGK